MSDGFNIRSDVLSSSIPVILSEDSHTTEIDIRIETLLSTSANETLLTITTNGIASTIVVNDAVFIINFL